MKDNIIIIDYGMGNLHSVKRKFYKMGINVEISSDTKDILYANKIIIPGVGHFRKAVENLKKLNLWEPLNEVALIKKIPVLGICLGMQLMAGHSEEGNESGLGWIDADVIRFKISNILKHKIPHMGWNNVRLHKPSRLFEGIPENSEFYFVHSYHLNCFNETEVLCYTDYEYDFVSAVEKGNIFGVQFHPEKSHDTGEKFLMNFANL